MALFVLSLCPFDISVGVGAFVIGLSQISSFFSLNINVTGDDFGFPKVFFLWCSGDVPRRPSYVFFLIFQLVRFARCYTSNFDFHVKIFTSLNNCRQRVADITSFEKHLESSSDHALNFFLWRCFFVALFVLSFCPFDISVGVRAFVIGLSQISSFFSFCP